MSSQSENQAIASQHEALESAVEELNEKLDAQQSQLSSEMATLRNEIVGLAQRLRSISENAAEAEADDVVASEPHKAFPFGDAPIIATPDASVFDFDEAASGFSQGSGSGDIEEVLLGSELAATESLHNDRSTLIQGIYHQDQAAMTLVGRLMVFRGANPERRPQLLKDLGEAYYRWRGTKALGHDLLREHLMAYLIRECEASGSPIGVELVQVGDRYDPKRHNAKNRGVEVIEVEGWVVLRSDGRVYTKANVVLK